jgi:glutaryl-CoA dehydrogenase
MVGDGWQAPAGCGACECTAAPEGVRSGGRRYNYVPTQPPLPFLFSAVQVWARADADAGAVRGFLVDRAAVDRLQPGALSTPEIQNKLSLRASITGSILLDGVRVPEEAMLPLARGLGPPFACLTSARYGIAWGALGAAEDCVAIGRSYVLGRKQFGAPLASQQLIQAKLADAVSHIGIGMQVVEASGLGCRLEGARLIILYTCSS